MQGRNFRVRPYLSINYQIHIFVTQFRDEEMVKKPPQIMYHTDPSKSTLNDVFSAVQRCHLIDFELTKCLCI
jgi:hypothetical protein